MENKNLEKDFKFFLDNLKELNEKYNNKFIVIKNCEVLCSYDDYATALESTIKEHEIGTFLIQRVDSNPSSFTLYLNRFSVVV